MGLGNVLYFIRLTLDLSFTLQVAVADLAPEKSRLLSLRARVGARCQ